VGVTREARPRTHSVIDDGSAGGWFIHLLGGFEAIGPSGRVDVPPAAARVLAYLVIQGRPMWRTTIAGAIWPDVDDARARANLRSTVCRIGALAPVLTTTGTSLAICSNVCVDVDDLQAHVLAVHEGELVSPCLRRGFDLELLPGWDDEWVWLERERIRQLELHLLDDIVAVSVQQGRYGDAVDAALRAIRLDHLRESSHAGLLRALLAGGNRAAAIAHFHRFATLMHTELGLSPSRDLIALRDEIMPTRPARRA
jgi:DNA-binding SARP family transcriptional activator